MIRVMIVEDEPPARRRLQNLIERLDDSFRVIDYALDGEEALEKLKTNPVDVIFSDIRMPVMDGVELMNRIRQNDAETMIVVVSGFQDFTYVTSALRAQAVDYLLKPVTESELKPLLAQIRENYQLREHEMIQRKLAAQIYKTNNGTSEKDIRTLDQGLIMMLFCAGSFPFCESTDLCPGATFWNEVSLHECINSARTGLSEMSWEFMGNSPSERILIVQASAGDPAELSKKIFNEILKRAEMPVSCAYSRKAVNLDETDESIMNLHLTLEKQIRIGQSLLFQSEPDNIETNAHISNELFETTKGALTNPEALNLLFQRIQSENCSQEELYRLFSIVLAQRSSNQSGDYQKLIQERAALADSISTALNLDDFKKDMASLLFNEVPIYDENTISAKIADYLTKNYREHITNQTLGTLFGYVPSYISILFRREFHMSPSEYLTDIRIEHAKQLLSSAPEMLVRDIALNCGFKSQHHFSRTFKKHEGVWPTEYLSQIRPS